MKTVLESIYAIVSLVLGIAVTLLFFGIGIQVVSFAIGVPMYFICWIVQWISHAFGYGPPPPSW